MEETSSSTSEPSRLKQICMRARETCTANFMRGVTDDIRGRLPWYSDDYREGVVCGLRILAPATYIFFASVIPALAFGQQISEATDGIFGVVHIFAATAITGVLQSVIGGQPLLIVGVSEPITLIWGYMYSFGKNRSGLGPSNFVAWGAWVCVWAALMIMLLAAFGACRYTNRFTRLSGELFGMLIAVLFMQQAIKGTLNEFRDNQLPGAVISPEANDFQWRLCNGLWALFISFGTVLVALKSRQARSWRFGTPMMRSFVADYGVTLSVVFFSCLSYVLTGAPDGVPRRLTLPNTWQVKTTWHVTQEMSQVPCTYIAAALVPALIIAVLFYFDHTVSAQMAQLEEFNLRKPPAYHYDLLLLGFMTLLCGVIGLPPVNGVLPQAPLHTKSLIILKEQNTLAALRRALKSHGNGQAGVLLEQMALECQKGSSHKAAHVIATSPSLDSLRGGTLDGSESDLEVEQQVHKILPVEAQEQRVSNLIQSLLVAACLGITPGVRKMPSSVLWGYFAYLSLASLPGSEFWERFLLLFVDPQRRPPKCFGVAAAPWLGRVKWSVMATYTLFQVAYTGIVYGITWIPIAGVVFPIPILLLIPVREFLLPRIFGPNNLAALDPASFEDEHGLHISNRDKAAGDNVETSTISNGGSAHVMPVLPMQCLDAAS